MWRTAPSVVSEQADAPPGEPPQDASGIASALVRWGDRTSARIAHKATPVYGGAGHYVVTVIVEDGAGNTTKIARKITLRAARP